MPECENCGAAVSPTFARVFGDNRNEVNGCLHCRSASALRSSETSGPR